jgi:hypothetical protein
VKEWRDAPDRERHIARRREKVFWRYCKGRQFLSRLGERDQPEAEEEKGGDGSKDEPRTQRRLPSLQPPKTSVPPPTKGQTESKTAAYQAVMPRRRYPYPWHGMRRSNGSGTSADHILIFGPRFVHFRTVLGATKTQILPSFALPSSKSWIPKHWFQYRLFNKTKLCPNRQKTLVVKTNRIPTQWISCSAIPLSPCRAYKTFSQFTVLFA